jgi:protein kinase C substrate 80K-H
MRLDTSLAVSFVALAISQGRQQVQAVQSESVRGVAPENLPLYQVSSGQTTWKCRHSNQHIPVAAINDDYCDCEDGSDEPGTSACPNSTFYCKNTGHIPSYVLSSRVNDGVCGEC